MDEDTLNMSIRKFLKKVGVTSQREIEMAVRKAVAEGGLAPGASSPTRWTSRPQPDRGWMWMSGSIGADKAVGVFVEVYDFSDARYGFRKNGSSENITGQAKRHAWGFVEVGPNKIYESYLSDEGPAHSPHWIFMRLWPVTPNEVRRYKPGAGQWGVNA